MNAQQILEAGIGHMQDHAATYDKPEGERSMNATVNAFFVITGHALTEEQGWLFMALLKMVRSQQGAFRADSYEDGAAYFALAGEAAHQERLIDPQERGGWTHEAIQAAAFKSSENSGVPNYPAGGADRRPGEISPPDWPNELRRQGAAAEDEAWAQIEARMDVIGSNGNEGEHYSEPLSWLGCDLCGAEPGCAHVSGCVGGARE